MEPIQSRKIIYDPAKADAEIKLRLKAAVDNLPLTELADFISTEVDGLTKTTRFQYKFRCFLQDGAYALHRSIDALLGFSSHKEVGISKKPPETIDVQFADGKRIKVPWGTIAIPGMGDDAQVKMGYDSDKREFHVTGQCEKRYVSMMDAVMDATRNYLKTDSIYRGHAIQLGEDLEPTFIDLTKVDGVPMYLTPTAQFNIQPIIARITKTKKCIEAGIDLKFGALLAGDYGTGKTLLAFKMGKDAIENNWTFIYLTAPKRTAQMLEIANELCGSGNGVLTFVEDIDLVLSGERDQKMNEILNLIDGGNTKNNPIISIFTTNHLERIDKTFLRGKRTGTIIQLTHFDAATAQKFIVKSLGETLVGTCETASKRVEELKIVPAFLAEILDRVNADRVFYDSDTVNEEQILAAIDAYKQQMQIARAEDRAENDFQIYTRLHNQFAVKPGVMDALQEAELV